MTVDEALRVIEGNCRALFESHGEPAAWRQREAFSALKAAIEIDRWQDIATAPKDGTVVDLWVMPSSMCAEEASRWANCFYGGLWEDDEPKWRQQYSEAPSASYDIDGTPTHWMLVPSPPKPRLSILNNGEKG